MKPCKYCIKNKRCKKQNQIKKALQGLGITSIKISCDLFKDRAQKGQRVTVTNLYVGQVEDMTNCPVTGSEYWFKRNEYIQEPLKATIIERCKFKPTKIRIELDNELDKEDVGENCHERKIFATKEANLKKIKN
jgi:hypothetical protein